MIKYSTSETNTPIMFFLNGNLIGETLTEEGSFSLNRVISARKIGIEYYDAFILRPYTKFQAHSVDCIIDDEPLNDFIQLNKPILS